jgi:hypothetical protein
MQNTTLVRTKNGRRTINTKTTTERIIELRKRLGYNLREADKDFKFRVALRTPLHLIELN